MKSILSMILLLLTALPSHALNVRPCWQGQRDFGTQVANTAQQYTLTLACAKATRWVFSTDDPGAFRMVSTTCKTDGTISYPGCTVTVEFKSPIGGHYTAAVAAWNVNTIGQANLTGKVYGPDYAWGNTMPTTSINGIYLPTVMPVLGVNAYTVPITNTGTEPLILSGISAAFANTSGYGATITAGSECNYIAPGVTCTLSVVLDLTEFSPPELEFQTQFYQLDVRLQPAGNTGTNDVARFIAFAPRAL